MRTLIVSNRLPITVERTPDGTRTIPSSGGLATGLRAVHESGESWWVGWPGDLGERPDRVWPDIERRLRAQRLEPVRLSRKELTGYYERIANAVLWPLFHTLPEQLPLEIRDWATYEAVNARFADAVAGIYRPGDRIWVHDYQLMLVPEILRRRFPEAAIGFFLHIPFPAFDVFRILPFRERLLEGLLGADVIGFHTAAYARHFGSSLQRLLGHEARVDRVLVGDREIRIGVFPMGVDAARWAELADAPEIAQDVVKLRGDDGCALFVGIDRLDYTKGIPRRLLAFERLLTTHPELHERVRLVQLAVPTRSGVTAYRDFRARIEGVVGRVNGRFGTARWAPVHYLHRDLTRQEVVALYRAANVMVVTPVRDGMNLVAKEFIACRTDDGGALVLSEFTGAASDLPEALLVNPYDIEQTAAMLYRALTLPDDERQERMRALRRRVTTYDVNRWAQSFLRALDEAGAERYPQQVAMTSPAELTRAVTELRAAPALALFLDYDGTLVPFAGVPNLAVPDAPLLGLLARLAERPNTMVHLVSGRHRATLGRWFEALPIWLHAEHGFWSQSLNGVWSEAPLPNLGWMERVLHILEDFRDRTPGSLIEQKTAALTWHYRMADAEFAAHQANELRLHLAQVLSNEPVEILPGSKVVEIRPHGIHKGRIVEQVVRGVPAGTAVLAMGDDHTDEDMFAALPPNAVAIHVGTSASRAPLRIGDWRATRDLLERLLATDDHEGGS